MKILVAEDEESIAMTYDLALSARGHEVTITRNGKLCLEKYLSSKSAGSPFNVVILDYRMPVMDGYETAKGILKINPDQRIIFASAYGKETLQESIKKGGMFAEILQKPFELDMLVDTVEDEFIYSQLKLLKINVGDLKAWNPSHQQLSDLLDALLRLRDPRTVFARLLNKEGPVDRRSGSSETSKLANPEKRENEESRIATAIVEDALGYLGAEWLSIFFYHLEQLGVSRNDIACKPAQFIEALDKILGSASSMVKSQIRTALESNKEVFGESHTIEIFKAKLAQVATSSAAREIIGDLGGAHK